MLADEKIGRASCDQCGAAVNGRFCSACGAEFRSADAGSGYYDFVDTMLKVKERKRYLKMYLGIASSPAKNTISLFQEGSYHSALRFLEVSTFIYTLTALSPLFNQGFWGEVAIPVFLVVTWTASYLTFYRIARRRSERETTFREFMEMVALYLGFTLPIIGFINLLAAYQPKLGLLLFLAASVALLVYAVRVWRYFWRLPGRTVFFHLFVSSLVGSIIGMPFLVVFFVLGGSSAAG